MNTMMKQLKRRIERCEITDPKEREILEFLLYNVGSSLSSIASNHFDMHIKEGGIVSLPVFVTY